MSSHHITSHHFTSHHFSPSPLFLHPYYIFFLNTFPLSPLLFCFFMSTLPRLIFSFNASHTSTVFTPTLARTPTPLSISKSTLPLPRLLSLFLHLLFHGTFFPSSYIPRNVISFILYSTECSFLHLIFHGMLFPSSHNPRNVLSLTGIGKHVERKRRVTK